MSDREGRRQRNLEHLVDQLELAGARWAEAEYEDGVDTGRHGVVSARVEKKRTTAMLKFRAFAARLREAVRRQPSGQR
jgi:hypothetical protein